MFKRTSISRGEIIKCFVHITQKGSHIRAGKKDAVVTLGRRNEKVVMYGHGSYFLRVKTKIAVRTQIWQSNKRAAYFFVETLRMFAHEYLE